MDEKDKILNYYNSIPRGDKSTFVSVVSLDLGMKPHKVQYMLRTKSDHLNKPTIQRIMELIKNDAWRKIWGGYRN